MPEDVRLARGARIRAFRDAFDLTQDAVAERGGFKRAEMSRFEHGEKLSSEANRKKLALGLGVSAEELGRVIEGTTTAKVIKLERQIVAKAATFDMRLHPVVGLVARARDFTTLEAEAATSLARGLFNPELDEEKALELLIEARESRARLMRRYAIKVVGLIPEASKRERVPLTPTAKESLSGPATTPRSGGPKPTTRERE